MGGGDTIAGMSVFDGPRQLLTDLRERPLQMALLLLLAAGGVFLTGYLQEKGKRAASSSEDAPAASTAPPSEAAATQSESDSERGEPEKQPLGPGTLALPPAEVRKPEFTVARGDEPSLPAGALGNVPPVVVQPGAEPDYVPPSAAQGAGQSAGPVAAVPVPATPFIHPVVLSFSTAALILGFIVYLNFRKKGPPHKK